MTLYNSNTPWQVLIVQPRSEKKAGLRLRELGFDACVLTQFQYRQWSDRRKKVEVVLFPNYVFFAADPARHNEVLRAGNVRPVLPAPRRLHRRTERARDCHDPVAFRPGSADIHRLPGLPVGRRGGDLQRQLSRLPGPRNRTE